MKTISLKNYSFIILCLILTGCAEKRFGDGVTLKDIELGKETSFRLNLGERIKAQAFPVPWDCTDFEFTWKSSDPNIASVDNYGMIEAENLGNCTITVSSGNISRDFQVETYEVLLPEKLATLGVKHLFLFENPDNLFEAAIGKDLEPVGSGFEMVEGFNPRKKAIRIPDSYNSGGQWVYNHLYLDHGFAANGGGKTVNQFTVLVDIKFSPRPQPSKPGPGPYLYPGNDWADGWYYCLYASTFDISRKVAGADGSFFWRPSGNYGVLSTYTTDSRLFQRDKWYRFIICVDMGVSIKYWKDGVRDVQASNGSLDYDNRSWPLHGILLFADDDGEDREVEVASLAIWDRCLSDAEVREIGNPRLK